MLQLAGKCCAQVPLCGRLIYCLVGACLIVGRKYFYYIMVRHVKEVNTDACVIS
jgi:hypothetical protein